MLEHRVTAEPPLSEPLSWVEICARYPDQWVALVEIDWVNENDLDVRSARVAGHGTTRRAPLSQARPLREHYEEIGHFLHRPHPRAPPFVPAVKVTRFDPTSDLIIVKLASKDPAG